MPRSSPHVHPSANHRRRALGQNLLADRRQANRVARLALAGGAHLPLIELGAGTGAITSALLARRSGRRLDVVELDPRFAADLRARLPADVRLLEADMLETRLPRMPFAVVSNAPFGIGTKLLRRLLAEPGMHRATLVLQWEVARKRAEGGPGTLLGAQVAPWFRLGLAGRIPARSFSPVPRADAGLLVVQRRRDPLVPDADRARFDRLVRVAFEGGAPLGRGIPRAWAGKRALRRWLAARNLGPAARARDLRTEDWVSLLALVGRSASTRDGVSPGG